MRKKKIKSNISSKISCNYGSKTSANLLTDSMFKYIFLRHITAKLPWALYSNKLKYCICQIVMDKK